MDYIFSPVLKDDGRNTKYNLFLLTPVRPKFEYASIVWKFLTPANAKKLERFQRKFVALCQNRLFTKDHVTYEGVF